MTQHTYKHKDGRKTLYEGYILVEGVIRYYTGIVRTTKEDALADLKHNPVNILPVNIKHWS